MGLYAIAPSTVDARYLTPGKSYEVQSEAPPGGFNILDDHGHLLLCLWAGCAHAIGGDWQRVEPQLSGDR